MTYSEEDLTGEKLEKSKEFIIQVAEPISGGTMEIWDIPFGSSTSYLGIMDVVEKNCGGKRVVQMSLVHRSLADRKDIILVELVDRLEEK